MPEGSTIFRAAETLRAVLVGRAIVGFRSSLSAIAAAHLVGRTVQSVEARGKNLLFHFDDGRALYTHMRMHGSWHTYRRGEKWQRPEWSAKVVLETEERAAACFDAPVVEVLTPSELVKHPALRDLGQTRSAPISRPRPASGCARREARPPMRRSNQRAVAGLGTCSSPRCCSSWACDPSPWRPISPMSGRSGVMKSRSLYSEERGTVAVDDAASSIASVTGCTAEVVAAPRGAGRAREDRPKGPCPPDPWCPTVKTPRFADKRKTCSRSRWSRLSARTYLSSVTEHCSTSRRRAAAAANVIVTATLARWDDRARRGGTRSKRSGGETQAAVCARSSGLRSGMIGVDART